MALPNHYQRVPGINNDEDGNKPRLDTLTEKPAKCRHRKDLGLRVLAAIIILCTLMYYGLRHVSRSGLASAFYGCSKGLHRAAGQLPTHYTLPSGDRIPSVALGVWQAPKSEVGEAVKAALETGYKHIDGAWIYGNEAEVGQALKASNVSRKDIWLTSKLWNTFHVPEAVETVLDESLSRLGTDYLDLYLIHWPVATNKDGTLNNQLTENPYPTWQKLEELVEKGKIRNIGVSNFNIPRLKNLTANPLKIKPAVNQVELNFWLPQPELLKWSKENDILLEAYSPLGSTGRVGKSLSVPEVKEIATELGITPAQVIISWHVQRGVVVLPKSVHPSRVVENLQITKLPEAAFNKLEKAATSHTPERGLDPSKNWGVDIFG
ncbi:Glycerol 2-dehydrogenase (NADP(+)) [Hypsizygus marmoreus]|uniref:Glycerol 2-dehydrogenase (NADP(+)) n=1 Tax=Hypsizygus marmoreus TaxID=39966 RepID=A0A369IY85_HYPMA|nr:Glycerol 2-dehydrogenase (NADP(+)) [Hypsizygus marmoreus]